MTFKTRIKLICLDIVIRVNSISVDPPLDVIRIANIAISNDSDVLRKQFAQKFDLSFDSSGHDAVDTNEAGFTELWNDL